MAFPLWLSGLGTQRSLREDWGSSLGLNQWVKDLVLAASCRIGRPCGSDPVLPRLWCRLAGAALIQPLARELPCTAGVTVKRKINT